MEAGTSLARLSKGLSADGLKADLESRALGNPAGCDQEIADIFQTICLEIYCSFSIHAPMLCHAVPCCAMLCHINRYYAKAGYDAHMCRWLSARKGGKWGASGVQIRFEDDCEESPPVFCHQHRILSDVASPPITHAHTHIYIIIIYMYVYIYCIIWIQLIL